MTNLRSCTGPVSAFAYAEHHHRQTVYLRAALSRALVAVAPAAPGAPPPAARLRRHERGVTRDRQVTEVAGGGARHFAGAQSLPALRSGSHPGDVAAGRHPAVYHGELAPVHAEPPANL